MALEATLALKGHKAGFPLPPQIASAEDVNNQAAARQAERMESSIAALLKIADLTPQQQQEIREQRPIAAAEQKFAREEIERLKRDREFVRKLLDGHRESNTAWTRLHQIISLPTASSPTMYPVK